MMDENYFFFVKVKKKKKSPENFVFGAFQYLF